MVKYSREPEAGAAIKTAKARASDLRTSFKNMRETAMAVKNMPLAKARAYLNRVLDHKACVPLRRYNGSCGRTPLTREHKFGGPGRFPEKSVKHLLDLLTNAESNAEGKELDTENLQITHIQVSLAKLWRAAGTGRWGLVVASGSDITQVLIRGLCIGKTGEPGLPRTPQDVPCPRSYQRLHVKPLPRRNYPY